MPIRDEKNPIFRYRLIQHVGETYLIGAGLGSVFHFIKGICSPSTGRLDAVAGGVLAVGTNMPRFAAASATYAGVVCAVESAVSQARGRDTDHWDMVAAGAATTGLFRVRHGAAAAARATLLGGTIWAGVAVFDVCFNRFMDCLEVPTYRPLPAPVAIITEDEKGRLEGRQILLYGEDEV